jgi:oligopeptide transport system permease protein
MINHFSNNIWQEAWEGIKKNARAKIASYVLGFMFIFVILGPLLSSYSYDFTDWSNLAVPPSLSNGHFFGTDSLGRDVFVRTLYGGRISLLVGIISTLVSLCIGVTYGVIAGYVGGKLDAIMMRIVDVLYALPFMFFVILLMVFFGRNIFLIFIAIGAVNWLDMARIVRGQTLAIKNKEFIEAAQVLGVNQWVIMRRHIIPNLLGVVVIYMTLTIPQVILVESFLSFLGLGVQEPLTSWGMLVKEGAEDMQNMVWLLAIPGLFLATTLFCFNFIGDGLRDALDPRDRT